MSKRRNLFWFVLGSALVVDQLVKLWARHVFADNLAALGSGPLPGVFEFTLTYNKGIALGMFQGYGVALAPIAVAMAAGAGWYSRRHPGDPAVTHFAMALLAAGALGNLFDRLAFGKVTDMFYFRAINFPVFNVADACITVSAVLLLAAWSLEAAASGPAARPKVEPADPETP